MSSESSGNPGSRFFLWLSAILLLVFVVGWIAVGFSVGSEGGEFVNPGRDQIAVRLEREIQDTLFVYFGIPGAGAIGVALWIVLGRRHGKESEEPGQEQLRNAELYLLEMRSGKK